MENFSTAYHYSLMEKWKNEVLSQRQIHDLLDRYLHLYDSAIPNKTQRRHLGSYVQGLLSDLDRKTVEAISRAFTEKNEVRPLQQFLTRSTMDDKSVLETYLDLLAGTGAWEGGMICLEAGSFMKKGSHSAGVGRQPYGTDGRIENCQTCIFSIFSSEHGYGVINRELFLPAHWFDEDHGKERKKCDIPVDRIYLPRREISLELFHKAVENGRFPCKWVGWGTGLGRIPDDLSSFCGDISYFADFSAQEPVYRCLPPINPSQEPEGEGSALSSAAVSAQALAHDDSIPWQTTPSTGEIGHPSRFKCIRCRPVYMAESNGTANLNWLYIAIIEKDLWVFLSNAPADTDASELHRAARLKMLSSKCLDECSAFLGLGHYEGRSYPGFQRHLLFVLIAHLFATSLQLDLKKVNFSAV